jgi:hypothetical protein
MDRLDEKIIKAYEDTILNPLYERRRPKKMKLAMFKKKLLALKKFKKKKPKKTRNAFNVNLWKKKTKTGGIRKVFKRLLKKIGIKEGKGYEDKILALAQHLDIDPEEVSQPSWGGYSAEGGDYEVMTDSEADDAAEAYILDSVWAFTDWFLQDHIDVEDANKYFGLEDTYYDEDKEEEVEIGDADEVFYMGMGMGLDEWIAEQQNKAEGGNDDLTNVIGNMNSFVEDAVRADGRGHFLNHYDGNEDEESVDGSNYYIYRTN